jgi:putative restriction endonuclease
MAKAIFTTKVDPTYDDLPEQRYHFPRIYLRAVEAAVGDWVIYYEPRRTSGQESSRGGRQAYFAIARLDRIDVDPLRNDHYYGFVSNYLDLDRPVPFRDSGHYFESKLRHPDGSLNQGAFRRAVRLLSDEEYELILRAGFVQTLHTTSAEQPHGGEIHALAEDQLDFERPLIESVVARPFRDAAFANSVKSAYANTCAMSGLKILNGGGRSEVQAAHIRPVADFGPDSVRNGIALSGTLHWMFDRGLVSVDDDYRILFAETRVPESIIRLLPSDRRLLLPKRREIMPHPAFLRYHLRQVFKG